jgi:hypothetical protein
MNRSPFALAALLGAGLLGLGCGGSSTSGPAKDAAPSADKDGKGPARDGKPTLGKADVALTAANLADEYLKDLAATHAKYKGKVVEVSGLVGSCGFNAAGEPIVVLQGADPKNVLSNVVCFTADPRPWNKVTPGQTARIKGAWSDLSGGSPNLLKCEIEDVSGAAAPTLTADELAAEYIKDAGAAISKYDGKWLILTGEFDRLESERGGSVVVFKTKEKEPRVTVDFPAAAEKTLKGLKPGQKVKALGKYLGGGKEKVLYTLGVLMDDPK